MKKGKRRQFQEKKNRSEGWLMLKIGFLTAVVIIGVLIWMSRPAPKPASLPINLNLFSTRN